MKKQGFAKWVFFAIGLLVLSFGINMMTTISHFGLSPWDSLFIALRDKFGMTIGFWMFAVNGSFTVIVFLFNRKDVTWGTVITMILISVFVDSIHALCIDQIELLPDALTFVLGNLCVGAGIGMYVSTSISIAPHEGMMLTLANKFAWSYRKSDIVASIGALTASLILNGPIMLGTIVLLFSTGFVIQFVMEKSKKFLLQLEGIPA